MGSETASSRIPNGMSARTFVHRSLIAGELTIELNGIRATIFILYFRPSCAPMPLQAAGPARKPRTLALFASRTRVATAGLSFQVAGDGRMWCNVAASSGTRAGIWRSLAASSGRFGAQAVLPWHFSRHACGS
jgi:hypothetical protein